MFELLLNRTISTYQTHIINHVGPVVVFQRVGDVQIRIFLAPVEPGVGGYLGLDSNYGLVRSNELAIAAYADRGQYVVAYDEISRCGWYAKIAIPPQRVVAVVNITCDHHRADIGRVQLLDCPISFILHQILHDNQSKKFGLLLQLGPGERVDVAPLEARVEPLVRRRDHPQTLLRVPLQNSLEIVGN